MTLTVFGQAKADRSLFTNNSSIPVKDTLGSNALVFGAGEI